MNIQKVIDNALAEAKVKTEKALADAKDLSEENRAVAMKETEKALRNGKGHRSHFHILNHVSTGLFYPRPFQPSSR